MTTKLITCGPEQTIRSAVRLLVKHQISGMPVVRERGEMVGILDEADCLHVLAVDSFHHEGLSRELRIADLMTVDVQWVGPDLDLYSIAQRMLVDHLRRLPVVENGCLVGQIGRGDVLRVIQNM